jgi:hypothetical protein
VVFHEKGITMQNLIDPAILFFLVGIFAGAVKSNLEIPPSIAKFLSMYLLMALGLKGGFAMAKSGMTDTAAIALGAAIFMAFLVPALGYAFLRNRIAKFDAAAVAAAYGSVSAVTFVTATQFLEASNMQPGGYMAVAMVVMESPAIIMAVLMANVLRHQSSSNVVVSAGGTLALGGVGSGNDPSVGKILKESFTDGAHLLLLGAMAVGYISGEAGRTMMQPFSGDLFKGMLAFFLLDMGLMVARNFADARKSSPVLIAYAAVGPLVHAGLALLLGAMLGMSAADVAILMVLSASASYIVVPAVLRYAIPEANPSLYFGLSLGITFPLNILVGIPLYAYVAKTVLG